MRYTHVIWDWNGTLLDDVDWCIDVENRMLKKRGMKIIDSVASYHGVFCFPVKEYYRNLGFDFNKEPYENLSIEYIQLYHENDTGGCPVFADALNAVKLFHERNIAQVILSASKRENLLLQVRSAGIEAYFDEVLGIGDIYAGSKIDIGLDYLRRNPIGQAVLLGDTTHDYEVARALGVDCLLIARGHQSKETLLGLGVPVFDAFDPALKYILGGE